MSSPTDTSSSASTYEGMRLSATYDAGIPNSARICATRASYDSSVRTGFDFLKLRLKLVHLGQACLPLLCEIGGADRLGKRAPSLHKRLDRFFTDIALVGEAKCGADVLRSEAPEDFLRRPHECLADRHPEIFSGAGIGAGTKPLRHIQPDVLPGGDPVKNCPPAALPIPERGDDLPLLP